MHDWPKNLHVCDVDWSAVKTCALLVASCCWELWTIILVFYTVITYHWKGRWSLVVTSFAWDFYLIACFTHKHVSHVSTVSTEPLVSDSRFSVVNLRPADCNQLLATLSTKRAKARSKHEEDSAFEKFADISEILNPRLVSRWHSIITSLSLSFQAQRMQLATTF